MAIIEVSKLKKSFGKLDVLKQITFDVNKNDVVAVIGPSGSGKSTIYSIVLKRPIKTRFRFGSAYSA